jgi:predicted nucleic acid-binding protein
LASGSRRLYCAQVKAEKGDADNLLAAIQLVSDLPEDHPLRKEIDKNIKVWSEQVLKLGEQRFQAGQLEAAIEIADKIPSSVAAQEVIEEQKKRWRDIWEQGEAIEQQVEDHLKAGEWNLAFKEAGKLVDLDNEYLANRHYTELISKIEQEKQYGETLAEAKAAFEKGDMQNLLAAVKQAEKIDSESYSYQEAQALINNVGNTLMAKAEENVEQENWNRVLEIAQNIPDDIGLDKKVTDLRDLALAGSQAKVGTVASLEDAIAQAQQLGEKRPFYDKAQALIGKWEQEIQGVKILNQAKEQARGGEIPDFEEAMATAQEVSRDNPRYQQAQALINQWNRRIEIIEDQPILNRAREVARGGNISAYRSAIAVAGQIQQGRALYSEAQEDIANWRDQIEIIQDRPIISQATRLADRGQLQEAIDTAQQISAGRALYQEAQTKINRWRDQLQRIQDRPIIARATRLADQGQLQEAIETAQQISQGRALYSEAQTNINRWRRDLQARQSIEEASEIAEADNLSAFTEAIERVQPARNSDNYRFQAERLINQWSEEIYAIAREAAEEENLQAAIRIAQEVPSQSDVYPEAREQIQQWQQELQPPQEEEEEEQE